MAEGIRPYAPFVVCWPPWRREHVKREQKVRGCRTTSGSGAGDGAVRSSGSGAGAGAVRSGLTAFVQW
jgi:hypothetical protein